MPPEVLPAAAQPTVGRFHRGSAVAFGIAIVVLVGAGIASWISVRNTTSTSHDLQDTLTVVSTLDKSISDVTTLQLTSRMYLASRDPRILDAYLQAQVAVRADMAALAATAEADPERAAAAARIDSEVKAFETMLAVGVPQTSGAQPLAVTPASGEAVGILGQSTRSLMNTMKATENAKLQDNAAAADEAANQTLLVTSGLTVVAVIMLAATFVAMNRQIRRRQLAEGRLAGMLVEARKLNKTAEDANRELEAFCYSVSHDLRAPLRTIDGFSQALAEDFGPVLSDDGQHLLTRIRAATQRMGQLIDDLLGLSRVTRGEFEPADVDLSELADSIVAELRAQEPGRKVSVSIQPKVAAEGDSRLLGVVMDNLLRNAWKYTGRRDEASITFGAKEIDGELAYFVKDNGAGFDMQYADKLFGVFQRLHHANDFPGTGVGLATVQRIVFRHGGRVWAEAAPDRGATFYFTLGAGHTLAKAA